MDDQRSQGNMGRTAVLVATGTEVRVVDPRSGEVFIGKGTSDARPTCLALDPRPSGGAWCGSERAGVLRSDDGGLTWRPSGLEGERIMSLAADPAEPGGLWAGTEPSAVWRSPDGGESWEPTADMTELPSSPEWAFPPRPETHHVRWIACHPARAGVLWVAVEAGALVRTADGGRTWRDRVPGGPFDTHELALHPGRPDVLRVSAGDGYYESADGGEAWDSPMEGLDVGYLRSVAIDPGDPEVVVVSASSRPRTAYVAGHSDGRIYRREGTGPWRRITAGWPDPPDTIAPLLAPGTRAGELWAADERGVHRTADGGRTWERVAAFEPRPANLRGLGVLPEGP